MPPVHSTVVLHQEHYFQLHRTSQIICKTFRGTHYCSVFTQAMNLSCFDFCSETAFVELVVMCSCVFVISGIPLQDSRSWLCGVQR